MSQNLCICTHAPSLGEIIQLCVQHVGLQLEKGGPQSSLASPPTSHTPHQLSLHIPTTVSGYRNTQHLSEAEQIY